MRVFTNWSPVCNNESAHYDCMYTYMSITHCICIKYVPVSLFLPIVRWPEATCYYILIYVTNVVEFKFDGFSTETCRSMVAMMDVSFCLVCQTHCNCWLNTLLLCCSLVPFSDLQRSWCIVVNEKGLLTCFIKSCFNFNFFYPNWVYITCAHVMLGKLW